jgi:hypothetical protein
VRRTALLTAQAFPAGSDLKLHDTHAGLAAKTPSHQVAKEDALSKVWHGRLAHVWCDRPSGITRTTTMLS